MLQNINEQDAKHWPALFAKASTGKIKTWQVWAVKSDNGEAIIYTKHGYIDGKLQTKPKIISAGKNIGKANETTPFEQAVSEAQSSYNKKIDKKYITEIPTDQNTPDIYLPMLAKPFKKYGHKITYPALVQPKLNGVRCLARKVDDNTIEFTSRKGKSYNATLGHLTPSLLAIMEIDEIFDGEIYVHGWSFQQIVRRVKKLRHDSNKLQYWVYDVGNDKMPTVWRNDCYVDAIAGLEKNNLIIAVKTEAAKDEAHVKEYHKKNIQAGFEGTIVRNINAVYTFDHRSMDLQKLKDFLDTEFQIIDGNSEDVQIILSDGSIDTTEAVVFTCTTEDGQPFNVRPKGTVEQRAAWFDDLDNIIGKKLTVRYFELSEDGIPIFPVGLAIRDYE